MPRRRPAPRRRHNDAYGINQLLARVWRMICRLRWLVRDTATVDSEWQYYSDIARGKVRRKDWGVVQIEQIV